MKSLYSTFKGKKHVLGKGEQGGGLTPTEMFMKYNLKDIISDCFASQLPCNFVRYWMRKEKIATQNEFHYLEIPTLGRINHTLCITSLNKAFCK